MSKITQQKSTSFIENVNMAFQVEKNWMGLIH
jgi:hypothetical protein